MNKSNDEQKKTLPVWAKILLCVFTALVILMLCALIFIGSKLGKLNYEDVRVGSEGDNSTAEALETTLPSATEKPGEDKVMNILLVGVDNDYLPGMNDLGNADGLMLLSVNTKTKQVILTSIMRDISVRVSDQYKTKITLVYHQLGLDTLIDTVEYNFDITIDNYAMVNYLNVIEIIDALGGLDIEIDSAEIAGMNGKIDNLNTLTGDPAGTDLLSAEDAGLKHLNGKQVAALLRIRNTGGNDQGRTERARNIVLAAKDEVADMGLLELNSFSDVVLQNITTDISTTQALGLLAQLPTYLNYEFVSNRIPIEGSYTSDGSFIYIDFDVNKEELHKAIYGDAA